MEKKVLVITGHHLQRDGDIGYFLTSKMMDALNLIKQNKYDTIIISRSSCLRTIKLGINQVDVMKEWLMSNGVSPNIMIEERDSSSRAQGAVNCSKILKEISYDEIKIVDFCSRLSETKFMYKLAGIKKLTMNVKDWYNLLVDLKETYDIFWEVLLKKFGFAK